MSLETHTKEVRIAGCLVSPYLTYPEERSPFKGQANWWLPGLRGWLLSAVGILWGDEEVLELDRGGGCAVN